MIGAGLQPGRVSTINPTIRRTIGITARRTGKATSHERPQALIHVAGKPADNPMLRAVAIPDTTKVMMSDRTSGRTIAA